MDSLTQMVLGAAVGEAVLGKKAGNKAMLYGAIAGTIPDLDVVVGKFLDPLTALEIHRGFSHSIVFFLLLSPVAGLIISRIERRCSASWKEWAWLMFLGLFTHSWLDAHTSWGTQMFWPHEYMVAFRNIFVIDPLYTLPFLGFLLLALRSRKGSPQRRRYNHLGLIVSSSYMLLTIGLKLAATTAFSKSLKTQEIEYIAYHTKPTPMNAILWTANVDTEEAYLIGEYSFFDTQPIRFRAYPKNHHLLGDLEMDGNVQRLVRLTGGWYTISENEGTLYFNDLRFGLLNDDPENPRFAFSYILEEKDGRVTVSEAPKNREDARQLMAALWQRMWGN